MTHKHKYLSNLSFKIFRLVLEIRDLIRPPRKLLSAIDEIRAGAHVLDYGCGPGSYTIAAAQLVGSSGKVYAADCNPLAINEVIRTANKKGVTNIHTLLTDSITGLSDDSVDVVLLIYVLHEFKNPHLIVSELDRILKPRGVLVVKENKLENDKVISVISQASRNLNPRMRVKQGKLKNKKTILFFSKGYN
jgi:ubiquinone/menaquinone biosynthesis C-methylase UbiE